MKVDHYPRWHFIGSKISMIPWIFEQIKPFQFTTILDLFGGTGIISHECRLQKKVVFYNDFLRHLQMSAFGLLNATKNDILSIELMKDVLNTNTCLKNDFSSLEIELQHYFFPKETNWILQIRNNIETIPTNTIQKNLLFFALTQSCLKKRPFHSFHGSFLKLRHKVRDKPQTWDLEMEYTFQQEVSEINSYLSTLSTDLPTVSISGVNASQAKVETFTDGNLDLVYVDPPFISNRKKSTLKFANYTKNYHVLELLAQYNSINSFQNNNTGILQKEKYLPTREMNLWLDQNQKNWLRSFETIIKNFQSSIIVFSYRSDSLITKENILDILNSYKRTSLIQTPHMYEKESKSSKFDDLLFIAN